MEATQTDKGPLGTGGLVVLFIFAIGLIVAIVWSVVRALSNPAVEAENKSLAQGSAAPAGGASAMSGTAPLAQEEIECQAAQDPSPPLPPPTVIRAPAAVVPANKVDEAVVLQKVKTKVNQRLVERLKQYVKDHPYSDNRELEKQIKIRESQSITIP